MKSSKQHLRNDPPADAGKPARTADVPSASPPQPRKTFINTVHGWHSRGYLPHFDSADVTQFVSFRIYGAIPEKLIETWREELGTLKGMEVLEALDARIESYLHQGTGNVWLRDEAVARLVQGALLYFDGQRYGIFNWVVMPNHVHVLFSPMKGYSLSSILHSWRSYTGKMANRILGRKGQFWHNDYFDRYIRNEGHFARVMEYIDLNPVNARLCKKPEDWPFSGASARCRENADETSAVQ